MPESGMMGAEPALRFGIFAFVLVAMVAWEAVARQRPSASPGAGRWLSNLGIAAASTLFARYAVPFGPVGAAILAGERGWGLFHSVDTPLWVSWLGGSLLLDLVIYVQHRVMHAVPLLWRLHRVHHADVELDVTTAVRFHPLEIVLSLAIKSAAVVVLGVPAGAVMVFEILLNAAAMFNHANVAIPAAAERWLRLGAITPALHRVHHSIVRAETDSNFGFAVPWWDRLFGTYRPSAAAGDAIVIGLPIFRAAGASRLDKLLIQPFVREQT